MPITIAREELRETILDAANRLLGRYGYRKMTMDDLASEAQVGKGTIYLCFPSKEEVALSTIDRLVDRLLVRMRAIANEPGPPELRLRRLLVERVMYRLDHRSHDPQSIDELLAALRPAFLERRERYFEAEANVLASVLDEGQRLGQLPACVPTETARALVVATNALLPYSLSARELDDRDRVAHLADQVAGLLIHGLLGGAGTTHHRHSDPEGATK